MKWCTTWALGNVYIGIALRSPPPSGSGNVGAVRVIAARAFDVDQANAGRRHAQHLRDALTIGIDALRMRPYRHRTIDQLRHGTGRTDRPVRLIGPRIGRFEGLLAQALRIRALRIHALRIAALENRRG